jgi:uncharacterized protein (DUF1697 family)
MKTYVALFRGINVGGKNLLPMKELIALLENQNIKNVRTYIQSGNVVFQSDVKNLQQLTKKISEAVKKSRGFEPQILVMEIEKFEKAIKANPFPEAESKPERLHLFFMATEARNLNPKKIEDNKSASERYKLIGSVFYLHAPDGIGRSKLAANVERLIGIPMTARNWRTANNIMAIAKENMQAKSL